MFASRIASILEAHRLRGLPLFRMEEGSLCRSALEGYLPIPVARELRDRQQAGGWIDGKTTEARGDREEAASGRCVGITGEEIVSPGVV